MTKKTTSIGVRLAIREEGNWINAYLAKTETMDGALLLGSILRGIVEKDKQLWEQWKGVMTSAVRLGVEDMLGVSPEMIEESAPLHERAGNA